LHFEDLGLGFGGKKAENGKEYRVSNGEKE
jgi:hypothetical protein